MEIPFLKNKLTGKNKFKLNRRLVTFLFCVLISTFFWLMMSLSKEYTVKLAFPVAYVNIPSDKVIANHLPSIIDIEVRSRGFNILLYKFSHQEETVLMDLKDVKAMYEKNHYYLPTNSRIDKITAQLDNDIKILRVYPDTIFFNFNKKVSRKVPVRANLLVEFDKYYQQTDSVRLSPQYIYISGAADIVGKIDHVETMPLALKNVKDSVAVKLDIQTTPELKMVDLSRNTVNAKINVTKYTESNIELPIEIENLPIGYNLKIFPDKVNIKYNVAFQNFEKINAMQFRVVVDYNKIEKGSSRLKVQLLKYPTEIKAIKLSPEKVEYIIRK